MEVNAIEQNLAAIDRSNEIVSKDDRKKGKVVQKNYVMNDLGALRKKLKHEGRKKEFILAKEAIDGSNAIIQTRASFFEFVKAKFIDDLQENDDIVDIQNAEAAKAPTESSGDAYVEYSMDIVFKVMDMVHTVKLTAYTTTCRLMIQPKGEQSGVKSNLGSRSTPRYFVDTFLLPWCSKAIDTKSFNEKLSAFYVDAINEEIKRIESSKIDLKKGNKSSGVSGEITDAKCVSRGCSFQGLNPNNKSAVGVCSKCGSFEHFACVRIKAEHKEDILKGIMKYYCSICFSKNPSIGSSDISKPRPRLNSIPVMGQGYLVKPTKSTVTTPIPFTDGNVQQINAESGEESSNSVKEITEMVACKVCDFETEDKNAMTKHMENNHISKCDQCEIRVDSKSKMEEHIEACHIVPCSKCDTKVLRSQADLSNHIKACHFFSCKKCTQIFPTKNELEEHMKTEHKSVCGTCNEAFPEDSLLLEHHINKHVFPCNLCKASLTSQSGLEKHMKETHSMYCLVCETNLPINTDIEEHNKSHRVVKEKLPHFDCCICKVSQGSKSGLEEHMQLEHVYHCDKCEFLTKTQSQMNAHVDEQHRFECTVCKTRTSSQEDMEKHRNEAHKIACPACNVKSRTEKEKEEHQAKYHPFLCIICYNEKANKEDLEKHIEDCHTYTCDVCGFVAISEDIMENHILDRHARPDSDGEFKCDDCNFKTKDKSLYGKHHKEVHGSGSIKTVNPPDNHRMEEELRIMKNNFSRLETLYQDSLDQINNVKSEYEAKLIKANDDYITVKTENEALKEKVEILFKLGRSYIDNCPKKKNTKQSEEVQDAHIDEIREVPMTEENDDNVEDLQAWTTSKMRGFKRTTPASDSAQKKSDPPKQSKPKPAPTDPTAPTAPTSPSPTSSSASPPPPKSNQTTNPEKERSDGGRTLYCHYYSNLGKCLYEERSGNACRFVHKQAPLCQSGTACMRTKCMYTHPNMSGRNTFLAQSSAPPMNINPWQMMMNPWVTPNQMQFPNPWSMNNASQGNQAGKN